MLRSSASLTASAAKAELNVTLFLDILTRALYARRLHGIHRCRKQAITLKTPQRALWRFIDSYNRNKWLDDLSSSPHSSLFTCSVSQLHTWCSAQSLLWDAQSEEEKSFRERLPLMASLMQW